MKTKELSKSFKERFASELKNRSEGKKKKEKIRLEDMSDEEHLWYTIRKQWKEEGKESKKKEKMKVENLLQRKIKKRIQNEI